MSKFNNLEIDSLILKGIQEKKFEEMTEVQERVIPVALSNKDVIAQAPTGTGKTIAFTIPILQNINENLETIQAVIIAPTRELAIQITEEIKDVSKFKKNIKVVTVYGGEYIERQITSLKKRPQIIVATPGRLMDHLRRHTIKLNDVKIVVLDEADEMLNMGFKEDIDTILEKVEQDHQTMLFSATISNEIEKIANTYLDNPLRVKVTRDELTVSTIDQKYIEIHEKDKVEVMSRIIDLYDYNLIMVFCNTKKSVDEVSSQLLQRGFMVEALHGDMKQMQRDRVMQRFRDGQINILVASDVAARGLDVDDVDVVFNYDVPTDEEYYVHRIGRTGRAKREGLAITLVTRSERYRLRSIVSYAKATINKMDVPTLDKVMKVRIERILKQAIDSSNQKNKYQSIVQKSLENLDSEQISKDDIINGLLMLQLNNMENTKEIEVVKDEIEERKRHRGGSKDDTRMFITLGKKDNIRIYNLTDMIVDSTSLTNKEINKIELHDSFSFFEIPSKKVDDLLRAFKSAKYKGRRVNIEVANKKKRR